MLNYLVDFFGTTGFAPHGFCLAWHPGVFWSHVGADLVIAFSYFSIPSVLAVFAWKRGLQHGNWVLLLFVGFIVTCGITHLTSIWTMWDPQYGVEAVLKVITAAISLITAVVLWFLLPVALGIPTAQELAEANRQLGHQYRKKRKAQKALEKLNSELEERVRQRTQELETANASLRREIELRKKAEAAMRDATRKAEDANHAKTAFLAAMSHEIRTPLNAIVGFSEMLQLDYADSIPKKAAEYIQYIRDSGQALADQMKDILDLTRIENGQIPLAITDVSVKDIIEPLIGQVTSQCDSKRLQFEVHNGVRPDLVCTTDPSRVQQIIRNFMSNAIKYNRDEGRIDFRVTEGDDEIVFEVADTGHGIKDEDIPRLFTPFDRLGADKTKIEGTGIGLAICHRLAEALQGMISVKSTPGEGSCFALSLPLRRS